MKTFKMLVSLAGNWDRRADNFRDRAGREVNDMIAERIFSEAQCFSDCADELKRTLTEMVK